MSEVKISIITPYYNCEKYIDETAKSVISQTFSFFEWIIIDDNSSKAGKEKLNEIQKLDKRIKVFYLDEKENVGPAVARDYGISKSSETAKYIAFLDADDLYNKTYLECCYWTLETHKEASWTYSDSINFGEKNFLWRKWYNVEWEKEENLLTVSSFIRKKDLLEVGGFGINQRKVYEDWCLWLKLIKAGKYPIRMNSLLTYYRQKKELSELQQSNSTNKKNAMKLVNDIKRDIVIYKDGIQYPKFDYNWEKIEDENLDIILKQNKKDNKIHVLMILPWLITGGSDLFNLSLISKMNKSKFDFTIITTIPSKNELRENFEKYATIYDLTTFLDMKDWVSFVNYIIKKNNINLIFTSNSQFGYKIAPYLKSRYPKIPIIDYVHMEEWYWRNGGYSRDSSMIQNILDKTYTCNENSRNIFIKYFKRKSRDVKTIYIGVDEKKFNPERYKKIKLKQKMKDKKVITFICRIAEQKRPFLFLEVIKKLSRKRNDFIVIIAGDGPYLDEFKEKVKKNNLDKIFKFVGSVKNTKKIYALSDVTINTSIKEGLALTSYESLAMGVPVVTSDVGGQRELVTEDVGIIVPCLQDEKDILNFNYSSKEVQNYVDAIEKIFDNLDVYKSNCRKRILNKFTIDKMIKTMEKEFEKIVKKPNIVKSENGEILKNNQDILKELISSYYMSSEIEYKWLVQEFNKKNVHINEKYSRKKSKYYEHTLEYKLKHPIVLLLRKMGIYNTCKKIFMRK